MKWMKGQGLGKLSARARYYYETHVKRWEKWSGRKLEASEGELGVFSDLIDILAIVED